MPSALSQAADEGSAPRLTQALLALFAQAAPRPDKLQWVQAAISADLPQGTAAAPWQRATAAVALAIDAAPAHYDRHGYHNRQHFCEVALTSHALCGLHRLPGEARWRLLLAALLHDAVHAGSPRPPFTQERASVDVMRPLLLDAGLTPDQVDTLKALVLTTETRGGTAWVVAVCQAHANAGEPPVPPDDAPELEALRHDRDMALQARLLCEADVLPSLGLGTLHALQLQQRLAQEWGRPLGVQDKLAFIDTVVQQAYLSDAFLPNVRAMRSDLARAAHGGAQG